MLFNKKKEPEILETEKNTLKTPTHKEEIPLPPLPPKFNDKTPDQAAKEWDNKFPRDVLMEGIEEHHETVLDQQIQLHNLLIDRFNMLENRLQRIESGVYEVDNNVRNKGRGRSKKKAED